MTATLSRSDRTVAASPAVGYVTVLGIGVYYLSARFLGDIVGSGKEIHLKADGLGEFVDASFSEMAGFFYVDPSAHIGRCYYTLEDFEVEEGMMRLVIYGSDKETRIGAFYGLSEGFGEAYAHKKKASLSTWPSVYENKVKFIGNSTVSSITFLPHDHIVTKGQPFDGIAVAPINGHNNEIEIDFKSGRKGSKECADFFNATVNGDEAHMIHTERGSNKPGELNFAFNGTLTINGQAFEICLGQGHYLTTNNWHLAATSLDADGNGKNGNLGKFRLEQDGSHTFKVSVKS
jgi:hypothetical protein